MFSLPLPLSNHIINLMEIVPQNSVYIVGGTVRDILIGKSPVDIDIAVSGDVEMFSKKLAKSVGGVLFALDKDRGVFRVVSPKKSPSLHYDISPIRGGSIIHDLALRDFTIDSIAIHLNDVNDLNDVNNIIDPFDGTGDIKRKCIKVIFEQAFEDDPLRLIRAFRLSGTLGFTIEERTLKLIKKLTSLLRQSARERIRDEVFRILYLNGSNKILRLMHETGLLKEIFTGLNDEGLIKGLVVIERLESIYDDLENLFPSDLHYIKTYLDTEVEEVVTNASLLKWQAFYLSNSVTENVINSAIDCLRMGNKARGISTKGVKLENASILSINLQDKDINKKREIYRFFKTSGDDGIGLLLYHLSVVMQAKGIPAVMIKNANESVSWYINEYKKIKTDRLISGDEVKEICHIPPGPAIKHLLDIIEENRVLGVLPSKEAIVNFLKILATNV